MGRSTVSAEIAIFQSDAFSRKWPEDDQADLERDAWGRDCAEFLLAQLSTHDMRTRTPGPFEGEGGWSFTVEMAHCLVKVFVMWAPIGDPPGDYWTVHVRSVQPILSKLFQKAKSAAESKQVRSAIEAVLTTHPATKNFRWLTPEEFERLY